MAFSTFPLSDAGRDSPSRQPAEESGQIVPPVSSSYHTSSHPVPVGPVVPNRAVSAGNAAREAFNLAHSAQVQIGLLRNNVTNLSANVRRIEGRRATVEAVACCAIVIAAVVILAAIPLFRRYYCNLPSGSST